MQVDIDRILRWEGRLKAGIDRIHDQLVKTLQFILHKYLRAAFAALETPTLSRCDRLGGSVRTAVANITDCLTARMEIVEGLCSASANEN